MSHQYKMLMLQRDRWLKDVGGDSKDCTVISVAITCKVTYGQAWAVMSALGRRRGHGTHRDTYLYAVQRLGCGYEECRSEFKAKTVVALEREMYKKARGRQFLIGVRQHLLSFNGVNVTDWTQGRRHRVTDIWEIHR